MPEPSSRRSQSGRNYRVVVGAICESARDRSASSRDDEATPFARIRRRRRHDGLRRRPNSMCVIRDRLVAFAIAVVMCHFASVSSAVVCQMRAVESPETNVTRCHCAGGSTGECPMHRSAHASPGTPSSRSDHFCACGDDESTALTSGCWTARLVSRLELPAPTNPFTPVSCLAARTLDAGCFPDVPPPRLRMALR